MRKEVIRKCIATGTKALKQDMFRIVRTPDHTVVVDLTGRQNGRGAYVLKTREAILIAKRKLSFNRALEVDVPESIYLELLELVDE